MKAVDKKQLQEMRDMQRRIDEGILLAHTRLAHRALQDNEPLVVYRNGQVVEMLPEAPQIGVTDRRGDPLIRKRY